METRRRHRRRLVSASSGVGPVALKSFAQKENSQGKDLQIVTPCWALRMSLGLFLCLPRSRSLDLCVEALR